MELRRKTSEQRRVARRSRRLFVGVVAVFVTAALPAWSAQVLDVRIGKHAGFSRIVFELDSPVGYKVERSTPAAGINELVISLDASAKPQTLRGNLDFIEHISVQPSAGNRSTVRIRLKGDDLRLKEMILASPPRIVLDVLNDQAMADAEAAKVQAAAVAKANAAKARQARLTASKEEAAAQATQAKQADAAKVETAARARAEADAKAKALADAKAQADAKAHAQAKAEAAAKAKAREQAQAKAEAEERTRQAARRAEEEAEKQRLVAASKAREEQRKAAEELAAARALANASPQPPASMPQGETGGSTGAPREFAMASKPSASAGGEMPTVVIPKPVAKPAPKPAATARPKATPPRPAAVAPASGGGLLSTSNIAVGGLGLLLLAGAGFLFLRRRNAAEVVDASAFEVSPEETDNPFAGLDPEVGVAAGDDVEAVTEELPISEATQAEVGIPIPDEDEKKSDESVSQNKDSQEKESQEGTDMDMVSENAQTTSFNAPPVGVMTGGDDVSRMVAEFERRMAAMETRIEELVDSKERLERQVAAQTEELRVQRAAIARTQRAVRNLSRPGEDAPTEPALRDPARPEGPRE